MRDILLAIWTSDAMRRSEGAQEMTAEGSVMQHLRKPCINGIQNRNY